MTSLDAFDLDYRPESYFTDDPPDEVVVAAVHYPRNIHQETTVVLARPTRHGHAYRVRDDHGHDWTVTPATSSKPLTLGRLINLMDSASAGYPVDGLVEHHDFYVSDCGTKPEDLVGYVVVTSDVYPMLGEWYNARFELWLAKVTGASS